MVWGRRAFGRENSKGSLETEMSLVSLRSRMKANVKTVNTMWDKVDELDKAYIMQGLAYHNKALDFILLHILPMYHCSWFFSTIMIHLSGTKMFENRGPQNVVPRPTILVSPWEPVKNALSQASPQSCWIKNSGGEIQQSVFSKPSGWVWCTIVWEPLLQRKGIS